MEPKMVRKKMRVALPRMIRFFGSIAHRGVPPTDREGDRKPRLVTFFGDRAEVGESVAIDVDELVFW